MVAKAVEGSDKSAAARRRAARGRPQDDSVCRGVGLRRGNRVGFEGREDCFDFGAAGLQEGRQGKMLAEVSEVFIGGESRTVGRNLVEYASRFTEVDRSKVEAIDHRRDAESGARQMLLPGTVLFIVGSAKGNVMHATNAGLGVWKIGLNDEMQLRADTARPCFEDQNLLRTIEGILPGGAVSHEVGQDFHGWLGTADGERGGPEAANCVFNRDRAKGPWLAIGALAHDELEALAFWIGKGYGGATGMLLDLAVWHTLVIEALDPPIERGAVGNGESHG